MQTSPNALDLVKHKINNLMNLNYKNVQTSLGKVYIFDKSLPIPAGYRLLRIEEGKNMLTSLNTIMGEWSVVGFFDGRLDGIGYGNKFSTTLQNCGSVFIIESAK